MSEFTVFYKTLKQYPDHLLWQNSEMCIWRTLYYPIRPWERSC